MRGVRWLADYFKMVPPLEVAIVAGIASIVGGLIVATTNHLLNERSKSRDREISERHKQIDRELTERARQLDFYKLIYPEKIKAALDLNNRASKSFMDIRAHFIGAQDPGRARQLSSRLDDMLWRAKSYEFLLGEDIVRLTSDYRMICVRAFLKEREFRDLPALLEGDVWAHEASYKELANALRRVVHLDSLDHLLLPPTGATELSMQRSARNGLQLDRS
jgi:hypothetical protein